MTDQSILDGKDIIRALQARGRYVRMADDGRLLVGPRELVDEADLSILQAHRKLVLAALRWEANAEAVAS
jgi:hypothetical protein